MAVAPGDVDSLSAVRAAPGAGPGPIAVFVIAGTRPECIKLAPLVARLRGRPGFAVRIVNSGQHRAVVAATFSAFGQDVDIELPGLPPAPNLLAAVRPLEARLRRTLARQRPDAVIVQGDTLTAFAGARAGRAEGLPVVHVEAGLRSGDRSDPFPEEWFRRRIAQHAALHLAPCRSARANLCAEGVDPASVHVVGNTGIDALRATLGGTGAVRSRPVPVAGTREPRSILVTLHRRENWDRNADVICAALVDLAVSGLPIVVPVHPNPALAARLRRRLGAQPGIALIAPLPYAEFVAAAAEAALLISDSGGLQEEAPHLGVPLLVPRRNTERHEALATGFVHLVPIDRGAIVGTARALLAAPRSRPLPFSAGAPYGAGDAAERCTAILAAWAMQARAA